MITPVWRWRRVQDPLQILKENTLSDKLLIPVVRLHQSGKCSVWNLDNQTNWGITLVSSVFIFLLAVSILHSLDLLYFFYFSFRSLSFRFRPCISFSFCISGWGYRTRISLLFLSIWITSKMIIWVRKGNASSITKRQFSPIGRNRWHSRLHLSLMTCIWVWVLDSFKFFFSSKTTAYSSHKLIQDRIFDGERPPGTISGTARSQPCFPDHILRSGQTQGLTL